MSLFEKYLGRKVTSADKQDEIEFYVRRVLTKEQLISRKKFLNQNNKPN